MLTRITNNNLTITKPTKNTKLFKMCFTKITSVQLSLNELSQLIRNVYIHAEFEVTYILDVFYIGNLHHRVKKNLITPIVTQQIKIFKNVDRNLSKC